MRILKRWNNIAPFCAGNELPSKRYPIDYADDNSSQSISSKVPKYQFDTLVCTRCIYAPTKKRHGEMPCLNYVFCYRDYILKPVMLTTDDATAVPDELIMLESSNLKSNLALRETRLPVEAFTTAVITALE